MEECVSKPVSINMLRKLAYEYRCRVGIQDKLYFPIIEFIEWVLPIIDGGFDYEIVDESELPYGTYALTKPDEKLMLIRLDVYNDVCDDAGRARFTLAHELAHLLLHGKSNISFARATENVPAYRKPEWQANTFAAELLIPRHLVKDMSLEDVMQECGVSRQCAEIQMKKYGYDCTCTNKKN